MEGGLSKEVVSDGGDDKYGGTWTFVTSKAGLTKEMVFHKVISQGWYLYLLYAECSP